MNRLSPPELDRLRELLADEIFGQLDATDQSELDSLRRRADQAELDQLDQTFGELLLAIADQSDEVMPVATREDLRQRGRDNNTPSAAAPQPVAAIRPGMSPMGRLGWIAAIAASVVAAASWLYNPAPTPLPGTNQTSPITQITTAPDTVRLDLAPQGTLAEGVSENSEVFWNQQQQQGVLRLAGVPENDPNLEQYQLWIFDATRGEFAVDGGVFDISGATERDDQGRLLVPFQPKLTVGDPAAFAVTREQPGGVVVTDVSGLILIGQTGDS